MQAVSRLIRFEIIPRSFVMILNIIIQMAYLATLPSLAEVGRIIATVVPLLRAGGFSLPC